MYMYIYIYNIHIYIYMYVYVYAHVNTYIVQFSTTSDDLHINYCVLAVRWMAMKKGCKAKLADWLKSTMDLEIDQDALIDIQSLGQIPMCRGAQGCAEGPVPSCSSREACKRARSFMLPAGQHRIKRIHEYKRQLMNILLPGDEFIIPVE